MHHAPPRRRRQLPASSGALRPAFQILTRPNGLQDGIDLREGLVIFPFSHRLNLHDDLEGRGQPHPLAIRFDQFGELRRIDRRVGMETDFELIGLGDRAQDQHRAHLAADVHRRDQILDQRRHRTASIANLVAQIVEVLLRLGARQPPVKDEPLVFIGHIMVRNVGRDAETQLGLEIGPLRLAAQLRNRLLHHLGVQLEADRRDLAVLLAPEQIAGAAMLEVGHRKFEPSPTRFGIDQFPQRLDAPLRVARDDVLAGNQQVCVGLLARAPDASAQAGRAARARNDRRD